jgi:hypothetical protein
LQEKENVEEGTICGGKPSKARVHCLKRGQKRIENAKLLNKTL